MHLAKIIPLGVAAAALGTSAYFLNESNHRAADLASARQERDALKAKVAEAETRLAQASQPSRPLVNQTAPASVPATKSAKPEVAAEALPPAEERERKLSAEARQAEVLRLLASYDPLFKKLGLSAAQIETFRALLAANLGRHGDLREYGRTQGARPSDPDLEALEAQADTELAARVRTAFGDTIAEAYQYFEDTGPLREMAHHLTTTLAASATPLAPGQAEQLVDALAAVSRGPDGRISRDPRSLGSAAALTQAQAILSPPQLAALRELFDARR